MSLLGNFCSLLIFFNDNFFFSISSCCCRFNSQISRLSCNRKEAFCWTRYQQVSFEINSFFTTLRFLWPYFFAVDLLSLTGFLVWVTVSNVQILTGKAPLKFVKKKPFPLAVHFLLFCWKDFKPGSDSCVLVQHICLGKQKYYRGVSKKKYVEMSCFSFRGYMYFFCSFISPSVSHNHGNKRFICP